VVKKSPGWGIWFSWHRKSQQRANIRSNSCSWISGSRLDKDPAADEAAFGIDQASDVIAITLSAMFGWRERG
jgi:hypothetical protein